MKILSSARAIELLVVLAQSSELSLGQLSRILAAPRSSVQKALTLLNEDRLVQKLPSGKWRATISPALTALLSLAPKELGTQRFVQLVASANDGVEFAALGKDRLVVVYGRQATPDQTVKARTAFRSVAFLRLEEMQHDDLRASRNENSQVRDSLSALEIIYGNLFRSFPEPSQGQGVLLGHLHASAASVSRAKLKNLARKYALKEIEVFGSAVRTDFSESSDVDIAIVPVRHLTFHERLLLQEEMEKLFQRDVDVVVENELLPAIAEAVEREGVCIYG